MKKKKHAEQEPLRVTWRGDLRELGPIIMEHASGFSIVERVGKNIKIFRMVPHNNVSKNLIEKWMEEHGTVIPPEVKIQRSFRRKLTIRIEQHPSFKVDRVEESPIPPEGSIERLDAEWDYYQKTQRCPQCKTKTVQEIFVYDDTCDKMRVYACICGKQLYPGGSAHLTKVKQQMKTPTKGHAHRRKSAVSV